jgi:hypothetical protein
MYALIIILLLIILIAAFIHHASIQEYFAPVFMFNEPTKSTKNMSYDLRGDVKPYDDSKLNVPDVKNIPPIETFAEPWLTADIYNPLYTAYTGPWLQSDIYNYDRGYNWLRPNGTPLYL